VSAMQPRRPSERLPEWVPVLLEPDDRKMLEDYTRDPGGEDPGRESVVPMDLLRTLVAPARRLLMRSTRFTVRYRHTGDPDGVDVEVRMHERRPRTRAEVQVMCTRKEISAELRDAAGNRCGAVRPGEGQ